MEKILDLLNDKSLHRMSGIREIEDIVRAAFRLRGDVPVDTGNPLAQGLSRRNGNASRNFSLNCSKTNYKGRIGEYADQYTDERLTTIGEKIIDDRALVDTAVVTKDKSIPISYKMYRTRR